MDLGCLASVKNAAASVKSSYRQIDLLVNCGKNIYLIDNLVKILIAEFHLENLP